MGKRRVIIYFYALLAAVLAAAAIGISFFCRHADPVLLYQPEDAVRQVERLMDAVCDGDFEEAETLLYGRPDLGADRQLVDPVAALIWKAYVQSLDYQLQGEIYATQTGLAQNVKLISLELDTATHKLGQRARELLNQRIAGAQDVSELYDENNEYREELVREILREAARDALEEDVRYSYRILPLQLVYSEEQWWVAADQTFLNAVCGSITE